VRYYFHLVHGSKTYTDETGQEFPTSAAAQRQGAKIASELAIDTDLVGATVRVVDELDAEIASIEVVQG
jgi:hypothetical protein